ncbi:uncharacterized protein LOC128681552 isoform X3 [Plodia interpunctella]|uniref:uncharacterized protein LOC128681552 isoform X3 n=2 Tax=Plodia interpunctella TaxID=58824 RepID=UPI0023685863|nr:uncharacterized protein LOC128681552 isoform X3 [Plodia interpunctella]
MSGEGMVAVVQSLRDARLAVTVVDGSRNKFSLVPNAAERVMQPQNHSKYQIQYQQNTSSATDPPNLRCDSSAQATDGRYASMYQTTHGNVEPTSPPCEVTEFPPQRVELCPGRENFEVGGLGSGETCRIPIRPQQGPYRCGTGWVGGGTMFSPRSSQQSDAFASSLRKYPTSSPDRSSELLERLVTYSQAKNFSRYQGRCSPNRCPAAESDVYQYAERSPRRNRWEEMRSRTRIDEYPTRDGRPRKEECERRIYNRTYDVRCVREVPRTKDSFRPNEFYQHDVRDGFSMPVYPRKFGMPTSVHTETQSISMCSKEVTTVPRSAPVKKNLSPAQRLSVPSDSQKVNPASKDHDKNNDERTRHLINKSIQAECRKYHKIKKCKSQEDAKEKLNHNVYSCLQLYHVNGEVWRKNIRTGHITPEEEKKIKKRLNKCLNLVSSQLAEIDDNKKKLKEDLTKMLVKKLTKTYLNTEFSRVVSPVAVFRVEVPSYVIKDNNDELRTKIDDWLKIIPIKRRNSLGVSIEKQEILECILNKIKPIISNKYQSKESRQHNIKIQILEVLEDLPVVTKRNGKTSSLNRYANMLIEDILNMDCDLKDKSENVNVDIFIREEILKFLEKVNLCYSKEIRDSERYLVNILKQSLLLDSFENTHIKEDLSAVLQNIGKWPNHQADYFVNTLLRHFNHYIDCYDNDVEDETQHASSYDSPASNDCYKCYQITTEYEDIDNTLSQSVDIEIIYKDQLTQVVTDWLVDMDFQIPTNSMLKSENRIVTDLVDGIISKSMLFSKTKDPDDGQLLKFQIFEWFNNEFGDHDVGFNNITELIDKISDLSVPGHINNLIIYQSSSSKKKSDTANQNSSLPYEDKLVDEIYTWLHDLPANMHSSQDATLENQLVKDLASNIEKGLEAKGNRSKVIDSEVNDWIKHALVGKPKESVTNKLKKRIKNVPYERRTVSYDYKSERKFIRQYEDLIDDWLNTIPLEPRKELDFMKIREDSIHDLAKKMFVIKNTGPTDSDKITKKLENVASDWLKKIPIHPRSDRKAFRDQYAAKLINDIQTKTINDTKANNDESSFGVEKMTDIELNTGLLEAAALDWLKKSSLYRDSGTHNKKTLETHMKEFAKEYITTAYAGKNTEAVMMKYVRMLYEGTNTDDNFIYNQCLQLKNYLLSNLDPDLSKSINLDDKETYKNAPYRNGTRKSPPKSIEIIRSAILNWSTKLPLKPDYNHEDFMSLVNQMVRDVASLIVHPKHSIADDNEDEIKQIIFDYVEKFPIKPDIKMDQRCDMMVDLWNVLQGISLYRDDNISHTRPENDSMFRNNQQVTSNNEALNDTHSRDYPNINSGTFNSSLKDMSPANPSNVGGNFNIITEGNGRRKSAPAALTNPSSASPTNQRRVSAPSAITSDKIPVQRMTTEQIYEEFDQVFNRYCQEIPLDISTDEKISMANMARQVFRNGIWKAYFALKSDEEISDNYDYFRYLIEERLRQMLDVILPQSDEMVQFKETFLNKISDDVVNLLKITHKLTDPPMLKNFIRYKLDRRTARQEYQEYQDWTKHLLIQDIINEHLLFINYKETDPVKANIYRKRLSKVINELINYIRNLNATQPQYINEAAMRLYINETLKNMPAIDKEILKDEVDEILLTQEIEQWFKNLPTNFMPNYEHREELKRRWCEVLAHKIHQIERNRIDTEDSHAERELRQEISLFLGNKANLSPDDNLNINLMVEELANRLKNLRDNKLAEYDSFSKEKPVSSTLAQIDPKDIIFNENINEKSILAPEVQNQGNHTARENMCHVRQPGILGTSQVAGPSRQMPNYPQANPTNIHSPAQNRISLDQNNSVILQRDRKVSFGQQNCTPPVINAYQDQNRIDNNVNESIRNNNIMLSECVHPEIDNRMDQSGRQSNGRPLQQSLRPSAQERLSRGSSGQEPLSRATASTARATTDQRNEDPNADDEDVGYRCRCLERLSRCARRFRPFMFHPMPFPCRFFQEEQ